MFWYVPIWRRNFSSTDVSDTCIEFTYYNSILFWQDLFLAMQAADIDAMDVTVTEMVNIVTVFDITGVGTSAVLENIFIGGNDIAQTNPSNLWIGVNVRDNAVGSIANSTFTSNTNMRHIFSASTSATLDIQNSAVKDASGGRVVVSHFVVEFFGNRYGSLFLSPIHMCLVSTE